MAEVKHFLDTSILRLYISSTNAYKQYLRSSLNENLYYCFYVKMEFIRGYIKTIINFYFTLNMPKIDTLDDAIILWANKFSGRERATVLHLITKIKNSHFNEDVSNKEFYKWRIADYIRRTLGIIQSNIKDIGIWKDFCAKSNVPFNFNPNDLDNCLLDFNKNWYSHNEKTCKIQGFLTKHNKEISNIISNKNLQIDNSNPDGFLEIVNNIEENRGVTCFKCSKLGDLIIALHMPQEMRMEHTDQSLDYLMTILKKSHYRHPSEAEVNRS